MDNLPAGLSQRDLDHIEGVSGDPRCTCGCAVEEHHPDGDAAAAVHFPCSNCSDCPDYTPEEDPRYG